MGDAAKALVSAVLCLGNAWQQPAPHPHPQPQPDTWIKEQGSYIPVHCPTQRNIPVQVPKPRNIPVQVPKPRNIPVQVPKPRNIPVQVPKSKNIPVQVPKPRNVIPVQDSKSMKFNNSKVLERYQSNATIVDIRNLPLLIKEEVAMPCLFIGNTPTDVTDYMLVELFRPYGRITGSSMRRHPEQWRSHAFLQFDNADAIEYIQRDRPHYLYGQPVLTRRSLSPNNPNSRDLIADSVSNEVHVSAYRRGTPRQQVISAMARFGNVLTIDEKEDYEGEEGSVYGHCIITFDDYDAVDLILMYESVYIGGEPVIVTTKHMDGPRLAPYWSGKSSLPGGRPFGMLQNANPTSIPKRRPLGILQNVNMSNMFAAPNQNLGASRKAKKRVRAQTLGAPTVPLNKDIDPVTGQSKKRKRVLSADSVESEGQKRARLLTETKPEEARKRDGRIHRVLESIVILKHAASLKAEMTGKIENLKVCEEEENLKLLALRSVSPVKKEKPDTEENNNVNCKEPTAQCELCCSTYVDRNRRTSGSNREEAMTILEDEVLRVKQQKEQLEKDLNGLTERVAEGKKLVTCSVCNVRKMAFINMCGHGGCAPCVGSEEICHVEGCKEPVTKARKIWLKAKLDNIDLTI